MRACWSCHTNRGGVEVRQRLVRQRAHECVHLGLGQVDLATVKIIPTDDANRADNKIADVELHFTHAAGAPAGLKLVGFAVRQVPSGRVVSYPARQIVTEEAKTYSVHVLRPIDEDSSYDKIRHRITDAYRRVRAADVGGAVIDVSRTSFVFADLRRASHRARRLGPSRRFHTSPSAGTMLAEVLL